MTAWRVKTRSTPCRLCRDARLFGQTTTTMYDNENPSSPSPPDIFGMGIRPTFLSSATRMEDTIDVQQRKIAGLVNHLLEIIRCLRGGEGRSWNAEAIFVFFFVLNVLRGAPTNVQYLPDFRRILYLVPGM